MLRSADSERIAELMRETAAAELLPRFRALAKEDIRQKRPGDVVTVADVAAEHRLAAGLAKILPGVPVVGEEAVESDPALVELIGRPGEACWIVDPLDGTNNFAAGRDRFAMIVGLVHDTVPVGGWILDVPRGHMAVALRGDGARLDGVPVRRKRQAGPLKGFVGFKIRKALERQLPPERRRTVGRLSTLGCAGAEYLEILAGRADFNLYRSTKAWDHAAGTLMVAEAGGLAERFDGRPYVPSQPLGDGLISAVDSNVMAEVRGLVDAIELPLFAGSPPKV